LSRPALKNVPASIHRRLLNKARESGRPFNELLQYFAMERFLYRLTRSRHANAFILKGGLMLTVWKAPSSRPTMDIDLLGRTANDVSTLVAIFRELCEQDVEPDGLAFDASSVTGEVITEDAEYEGVRIRCRGSLGPAQVTLQIDVAFGDVIVPQPEFNDWPTILDLPAPRLRGYSRESTIAEKLEAMVRFGVVNSRLKDFFDIWFLSRQFDFDGETLSAAIRATFASRQSTIPALPVGLSTIFGEDQARARQWREFVRRNRLGSAPEEFAAVIVSVADFLTPVTDALASGRSFSAIWRAPGPWS